MIERVNCSHPDKVADRIAGAIVDLAYYQKEDPKIAVEVLIGHGQCTIIIESNVRFKVAAIKYLAKRIAETDELRFKIIQKKQDEHLSKNQEDKVRCGDNGIFKGLPVTEEESMLANLVEKLYKKYPTDGKYILDYKTKRLIACQSYAKAEDVKADIIDFLKKYKIKSKVKKVIVNPLGDWTGGLDVDSGATNRKLGSDMGHAVTGGGLHGKDMSKADVALNLYAFRKAQQTGEPVEICCAIGDEKIDGKPYGEIVKEMKAAVSRIGGFEGLAEWGLL